LVEAWDTGKLFPQPLGTSTSNASGAVAIPLSDDLRSRLVAGRLQVFFRVLSDRLVLADTHGTVLWDPVAALPVIVSVPAPALATSPGPVAVVVPINTGEAFEVTGRSTDAKGRRNAAVTWGSQEELIRGDPSGVAGRLIPSNVEKTPAYIALGHELIHAWRITEGLVAPRTVRENAFMDPQGKQIVEKAYTEELIVTGLSIHGEPA